MKRAVAYAGLVVAALTLIVAGAHRLDAFAPGLSGRYSRDGGGPPVSRIDRPPFSDALREAPAAPGSPFSVTWTGQLWASASGTYTLAISADAGTSLFVDGRMLFDNAQHPDVQFASGTALLSAGSHAVFITYAHPASTTPLLDLAWGLAGRPLATVPASALQPRRAGALRVALINAIDHAPIALAWMWAAELAAAGLVALLALAAAGRRALIHAGVWRGARWVLLGSLLLTTCGLWWGLPAEWVPIELTPTFVLDGLWQHFSRGWYDAYPPLHYYVLSAAISPLLVLQAFTGADIYGVAGHTAMVVIFRLVTVVAASGVVCAACLCAAELYGRRAGVAAGAAFALTTPFVFYSKTANVDVPYLFWFGVSMVFYLRLLANLRLRDFVLFAAAAACAVCTKDQAYGLYVLVPFAVVHRIWRDNAARGMPHPLARAWVDRRLLAAGATAALAFGALHNLLFNLHGFIGHVLFITGPGADYRIFPATLAGRWSLLVLTLHLIQISLGWPLFLLAAAGAATALVQARTRTVAVYCLVPAVSYYLFFINVILYNYDRFVLPVCFVLALFAGMTVDRLLAFTGPRRAAAIGAIAATSAYTLLYAGTVDVLMVKDSRYQAQRWMRAHVGSELVGVSDLPELLPEMRTFRTIAVADVDELEREHPRFFVLNVDYARAAAPGTRWARLIDGLTRGRLGYKVVWRFRSAPPWSWLPGAHPDLVGPREETVVVSVLRDINPTIEILEREQ